MTERPRNDLQPSGQGLRGRPAASVEGLRGAVLAAADELTASGGGGGREPRSDGAASRRGAITLERPRGADFGDYSTNAALLLAPGLGSPPRQVAEQLGSALAALLGDGLERFEVAGPGFLNLFVSDRWLTSALQDVAAAGDAFGGGCAERPERMLVEFVSANPTGPMHVGHARNAAYGDSLARMLAFAGHDVEREFYVNDAGSQVRKLGESIQAVARAERPPADGYQGAYVAELAADIEGAATEDAADVGRAAVATIVDDMRRTLIAFGVQPFDRWVYESEMHAGEPSDVERTLAILEQQGHTFRRDGALWLRTTDFGDDKDRVLVRSDGEHTYFASDVAYHERTRERGYQRQIDVWGADHHGYVLRIKAAYQALGGDPDELELLIMQLVHLMRSGQRAQMSKRAGEFVTLEELVSEIGVDAARWYLLARSHDTPVDLDLDLAREQSLKNPVYYVQYAHARIVSVLAKAGAERVVAAAADAGAVAQRLHPSERALIEQLLGLPGELAEAAARRAPHRLAVYALALAQDFTAFYRDCRVVGAETVQLESLRIVLCVVAQRTIARCLELLGVSAPLEM